MNVRKVLRLRQLRREREMTQEQLAARVKLNTSTINAIESGRNQPSFGKAMEIAAVFGKTAEEVFAWVEVPA